MAGIDNYQSGLRSAVRGFWSGVFDFDQFFDVMILTIERGLTRAWEEGAKECGIQPDEASSEEKTALKNAIVSEQGRISGLADFVEENKKGTGKLGTLFKRLKLWVNRYKDINNEAKIFACADEKLIWLLGVVEKHCKTCPRLHRKVKRANFWKSKGVRPQNFPNEKLECQGFNCKCDLKPTSLPVSRGPLPSLP